MLDESSRGVSIWATISCKCLLSPWKYIRKEVFKTDETKVLEMECHLGAHRPKNESLE
jgi:hypothetical protein